MNLEESETNKRDQIEKDDQLYKKQVQMSKKD